MQSLFIDFAMSSDKISESMNDVWAVIGDIPDLSEFHYSLFK